MRLRLNRQHGLTIGGLVTFTLVVATVAACAVSPRGGEGTPVPKTNGPYASGYALVSLDGAHARAVASVVGLIDAYNAGDLDGTLARLADNPAWSDCDYRAGKAVAISRAAPRAEFISFLRARFADHDRLELGHIEYSSPEDVNANGIGLGVWFTRRSSDTLRELGYASGIQGPQRTKIALSTEGLIVGASLTASPTGTCRPTAL